jgi:antitoxin (DNA-binding transcriptional repressor) of toxin-antitoxin stability system
MYFEGGPMEISFLDLRKNPGKLIEALERNERVILSRRGKVVARIEREPSGGTCRVMEHEAWGIWADRDEMEDPVETVRRMREGRHSVV